VPDAAPRSAAPRPAAGMAAQCDARLIGQTICSRNTTRGGPERHDAPEARDAYGGSTVFVAVVAIGVAIRCRSPTTPPIQPAPAF
jgi:hypothetical protein